MSAALGDALPDLSLGVHTMRRIYISGYKRLGIVCSGFWALFVVTAYYLGIYFYPSFLTNALSKLYVWVDGPTEKIKGVDFTPLNPTPDAFRLSLLVLLPICVGWLVFYIIPRSIRWVRDGFQHEHE
jgi:hypothetical protein